MTAALSEAAVALVLEALAAAPPGGRTAAVREAASRFGVSAATVYRAVGGGSARRRAPGRPEYREWVRIAVALAHRAPKPAPLDVALRAAVAGGDLPPAAAAMPLGTAYRVARELGLGPAARRTPRIAAEWPMQAVLVDASTSAHLVVDRRADPGDDDPPVALHRPPTPAGGYKNKPLPADRRRLLVYGVWDLCTGCVRSRYAAARGESALDAVAFLCWALAEHEDRRVVMHGVPDDLWSDQGPLAHSAAARDLIERLGVNLVLGAPYAKTRMGGVERAHRTRWGRFERGLFLGRRPAALRVSDLNARLLEFEVEENGRRPARTPVDGRVLSRTAAWTALARRRPAARPLRRLPADPLETLAAETRRRVDRGGLVRWGGRVYESPWHDRTVVARRAVDGGGDIALEDEATGERCVARLYRPRPYGEVRTGARTPLERLAASPASAALAGADPWAPAAGPARVVPLPAPAAPAAPLPNPLPAGAARCRDLAEAWRVFGEVYPWPVPPGLRARIEGRFAAAGLDREAVAALAQELVAAAGGAARTGGTG